MRGGPFTFSHYNLVVRQTNQYPIPEPEHQTRRVPALMGPGDQSTPPPPSVAAPTRSPPLSSLYKHKSWSPDIVRDEEWLRRKDNHYLRHRRQNMSVTDEDIDELKACIELGFGFGESNDRLSDTLPALGLYYAVNKQYHDTISKSPFASSSSLLTVSDSGLSSSSDSTNAIFDRGDDPQIMKTRLKQWAQVVACSLRQSSPSPLSSL